MPDSDGRVEITAPLPGHGTEVLTPGALAFVARLHRTFNPRRLELLAARAERQRRFDAGELPDFLPGPPTFATTRPGGSHRLRPTSTTVAWRSPGRSSRR